MKLQNTENLDITAEKLFGCDYLIKVGEYDYVVITDVEDFSDELQADIVEWIEETYYNDDYKCTAYEAPHIRAKNFT